jgi:hypothetical protein
MYDEYYRYVTFDVVCVEKDRQGEGRGDEERKPVKKAKELRVLDPKTAQNLCKSPRLLIHMLFLYLFKYFN